LKEKLKKKKNNIPKLITVIGPTASGKTALAIKIAKKFNGEIINADSRQIYKYLDIGTAKGKIVTHNSELTGHNFTINGVPIHLINIVEPDEVLTLAEYQKLADAVIKNLSDTDKIPILVGGTGLYIDAVVFGYDIPHVEPDVLLRKELEGKSVEQLQKAIIIIDRQFFENLNESDKRNPRRLIRAIELAQYGIKPYEEDQITRIPKYQTLFLSPHYEREKLYKRINKRVYKMIQLGFLKEVKNIIKKGYTFKAHAMSAIAYPLAKKYLDGLLSKEEFIEKWQQAERNYARRQITWFRRYKVFSVKKIKDAYEKVEIYLKS